MKARTATSPWRPRPQRSRHPILGCRQTWRRSDGRAWVDQFFGGSRNFIALVMICGGAFLSASRHLLEVADGAGGRRSASGQACRG